MAEIRLGSVPNMKNINLGSVEIQEVYLGTILVWQNNIGPAYVTLTWDGDSFSLPARLAGEGLEDFTGTADSPAADFNGVRTINIVVGGLLDPDDENDPLSDDFVVGYRLQRPDTTYAAGDPADTGVNSFGAPVSDFGASLPGVTATWDAGEEEFTAGLETVASVTIPVLLRDIDDTVDANVVDSNSQQFVDDGNWILTIIDSRGGESGIATMDVTLTYDDPNGRIAANATSGGVAENTLISIVSTSETQYMNVTIGGPANATFKYLNQGGGPLSTTAANRYVWTCDQNGVTDVTCPSSSTGSTYTVPIPQYAGGSGAGLKVNLTALGRSYFGNTAMVTPVSSVYFHSGASCSPGITVSDSSFAFAPDTDPAVCAGAAAPSIYTVSCSGTGCGFSSMTQSGTSFTEPNPTCISDSGPLPKATVSVSGTTTGVISGIGVGGNKVFTADGPAAAYSCNITSTSGYANDDVTEFRSSTTCDTSGIPASINISGTFRCRIDGPTPGGPACGSAANPTSFCLPDVSYDCGSVSKGGTGSASVTCSGADFTAPNTSVSMSGGVFEGQGISSDGVVCIADTLMFSGTSTHTIGGSVRMTAVCTGAESGTVWNISRGEGTSGHGPGAWTENDFGTGCDTQFSSRTPGEAVSCETNLRYFISGWGNVDVAGPSFSGTVG